MAAGFPAYHKEIFRSPQPNVDLVFCAVRTLESLRWKVRHVTPNRVIGAVPYNLLSVGEEIEFLIQYPDECQITSKCMWPTQFIDWGKNRKNIEKILPELQRQATNFIHPMAAPPPPINPR